MKENHISISSMRLLLGGLAASFVLFFTVAPSASAVPMQFFGLNFSSFTQDPTEWEAIGKSGAKVLRMNASWNVITGSGNWRELPAWEKTYDKWVELAAKNDVTILPDLYARKTPGPAEHQFYRSADPEWGEWFEFVYMFVQRYGYGGAFWSAHPSVPYHPMRVWEVWNEENLPLNNPEEKKQPKKYAEFFNATANTIRNAQNAVRKPGEPNDTKVIVGGFCQMRGSTENVVPNYFAEIKSESKSVSEQFHASYDGVGVHPYSFLGNNAEKVAGVQSSIGIDRNAINEYGGTAKTIWITELGWPVEGEGLGGSEPHVSAQEQGELLTSTFSWLAAASEANGIKLANWYFYRDISNSSWAYHCGLRTGGGAYRPAWKAFQAQTGAPAWNGPAILGEDDNFSGPHVVGTSDGRIDALWRTPSGGLGRYGYSPSGGPSSGSVAGESTSVPHVVEQSDGTVDAFWRTPGNQLGHAWRTAGGTEWSSAPMAAELASDPHPVVQPNGTLDVFWRTPAGKLGHYWFVPGAGWSSGEMAEGVASDPFAVAQPNGTIDVFWRTSTNQLGHAWYTPGGAWSWTSVSETLLASDPHPVVQPSGTLDVFWRTPSAALGHYWFIPGTGAFAGTVEKTELASDPHPVVQPNGTLDVFWRTPAGKLGHYWFIPGIGGNSNTTLVDLVSDPYPVVQPDGTLDVFWRNPSNRLGHYWFVPGLGAFTGALPEETVMSSPHAIAQSNGTIDVFWRTPTGGVGHDWYSPCCGGWHGEVLEGSVAVAIAPSVTTETATSVKSTSAVLNAKINPQGSTTSYQFEYGKTASYGSKFPVSGKFVGSGTTGLTVSEAVSGLAAGTTYHYRVVATNDSGSSSTGEDKTFTTEGSGGTASQLSAMAVTEPFNGSAESLANFGSQWSTLGWAGGSTPKGSDTTTGWRPVNAHPTVNGCFYNTTVTDGGSGIAAVVTMAIGPGSANRYFSLWLDMPTPTGAKAGYELSFSYVSANVYTVTMSKWSGGSQTPLASPSSYAFANGDSLALVDQGGTVSAWINTGSGFNQIFSASDATFSGGKAGLEGAGNITRLTDFKVGFL